MSSSNPAEWMEEEVLEDSNNNNTLINNNSETKDSNLIADTEKQEKQEKMDLVDHKNTEDTANNNITSTGNSATNALIAKYSIGIKRKRKQNDINENKISIESESTTKQRIDGQLKAEETKSESLPRVDGSVEVPMFTELLDKNLTAKLKEQVLELVFNCPINNIELHKTKHLPGTMPITLTRKIFQEEFKPEQYWVTEKSDGIRKILFLSKQTQQAYLIDRAWHFEQLTNSLDYYYVFSCVQDSNMILDGELTEDYITKSYRFAVFDVIYYNNIYYAERNLIDRHKIITQIISLYQLKKPHFALPHLPLNSKAFREFKYIQNILDSIKPLDYDIDNKEPLNYLYKDDKGRCNLNDGLIFTPIQENYFCKGIYKLYKWKWLELNTIDFLIEKPFINLNTNKIDLYVGDYKDNNNKYQLDNPLKLYSSCIPNKKTLEWIEKFKLLNKDKPIVECAKRKSENNTIREWQIVGYRADKTIPNFITVAKDTEEAINDDIQAKEFKILAQSKR